MSMSKRIFIAWASFHRRSELLATYFKARLYYVYSQRTEGIWHTAVRYLVQTWQTWHILRRERAEIIFVQNPPVISVLAVSMYTFFFGGQIVIDSHTGAFLDPRWRWSAGLHRRLSQRALTTIVHNKSQEKIVQEWGCPYIVISFTPGDYPPGEPYPLSETFNVAVICGFFADEPIEVLFEAARLLKDVNFYLSGDAKRLDPRLQSIKPENIHLTGYLPYERYVGLLRGADAIMDLVKGGHTLLMGAFEAVSLGVPLIVSDWQLLRDYFSLGTVHVPNTVDGICAGVRQAQEEHPQLQDGIQLLREQLQAEWNQKAAELEKLMRGEQK
jgi:glycosyltransferase involved in cell wall biosynthesis